MEEVLTGVENLALLSKLDSALALNPETREIRLLSILPGKWTDEIRCELRRFSLDSRPRYEALSYTWGDPSDTRPIILDGCEVRVTVNLESALRRLRQPDTNRVLWADALCIDQSDLEERNHQLVLMRDIFQNCDKAVIWLGEVRDARASQTSKDILAEQADTRRALKWDRVMTELCDEDLSIRNGLHDLTLESYSEIVMIFISFCQLREQTSSGSRPFRRKPSQGWQLALEEYYESSEYLRLQAMVRSNMGDPRVRPCTRSNNVLRSDSCIRVDVDKGSTELGSAHSKMLCYSKLGKAQAECLREVFKQISCPCGYS